MNGLALAPHVCVACNRRKKACDKQLPSCGACSRRGVPCKYEPLESLNKSAQASASAEGCGIDAARFHQLQPTARASVLLMDSLTNACPSKVLDFNETVKLDVHHALHYQVVRIIKSTGVEFDEIIYRYFSGPHGWMPIVSRQRFQTQLQKFNDNPTAAFSILLLAMTLVVVRPGGPSDRMMDHESLYLTTKMLFSVVHNLVPTSQNLMKAALIIAGLEYVQRRCDAALMTITTCARIAITSNCHLSISQPLPDDHDGMTKTLERRSMYWVIVNFERLIMMEMPFKGRRLLTALPSGDAALPLEPEDLDACIRDPSRMPATFTVLPIRDDIGSSFARSCQATYLLDQVLRVIDMEDSAVKIADLWRIDAEVVKFLRLALAVKPCMPVAVASRALFELHDHLIRLAGDSMEQKRESYVALDAVTQILVDVGKDWNNTFGGPKIDTAAPTDPFILTRAIDHLKSGHAGSSDPGGDGGILQCALDNFTERWQAVGI